MARQTPTHASFVRAVCPLRWRREQLCPRLLTSSLEYQIRRELARYPRTSLLRDPDDLGANERESAFASREMTKLVREKEALSIESNHKKRRAHSISIYSRARSSEVHGTRYKTRCDQRQRQQAIVADMVLTIVAAMQRVYRRKHVGASWEELLVSMVVRRNDEAGKPPLSIADIEKILRVPRSNVQRAVRALIREGVTSRVGRDYRANPDFFAARVDAAYMTKVREAIITAARELETLDAARPAIF